MKKNNRFIYAIVLLILSIQVASFFYFKNRVDSYTPAPPESLSNHTVALTSAPVEKMEKSDSPIVSKDEKNPFDEKKLHETIKKGVVMITTKVFKATKQINGSLFSNSSVFKGTGFIVDKENGLIVTNHHVVGNAVIANYEIKFSDGTVKKAKIRYHDPLHDFAFLQLNPQDLPKDALELKLIDRSPEYNDKIFAMGNTHGSEFSSYSGRIFDLYASYGSFSQQSINFSGLTSGASGSPVFDKKGDVLALLYGGNLTSGAALNIRYVKNALKQLKQKKDPQRKNIGVIIQYQNFKEYDGYDLLPQDIQKEYQSLFSNTQNKILTVLTKISDKDTSLKFKAGDIIWKVNNTIIGPQLQKFQEIIDQSQKEVKFEIYRDGKPVKFTVTPYEINNSATEDYIEFADTVFFSFGEEEEFVTGSSKPGVYISLTKQSSPFSACLKQSLFSTGTIVKINEINGHKIDSLDNLEKLIPELRKQEQFSIRYIDYMGQKSNEMSVKSVNHQERFVIAKYESKFDNPKRYTFNKKTLEWNTHKYKTK